MAERPEQKTHEQRPLSVSILAGLQFVQSLGFLAYGIHQVATHVWPEGEWVNTPELIIPIVFEYLTSGIGLIVLGVLTFIVSIELLRLKNWAWLASMTLQGIGLTFSLLAYARQEPNYPAMFLGVLLVFYLNQHEVQEAFRRTGEEI